MRAQPRAVLFVTLSKMVPRCTTTCRIEWVLINAECDTRAEALEYQQWAEYVAGEIAWIVER